MFGQNKKHVDQEIFSMHDSKANTFGPPMFSLNSLTLLREIEQIYQDPQQAKNQLVTNPEDFSLFKIGEYNRQTGKLEAVNPTHVVSMITIENTVRHRQHEIAAKMQAGPQLVQN